jgi:hypothetical protein
VPDSPAGVDPEQAAAIRAAYEGKTVGILPGYGGNAPFWLADAGVSLRELTWDDLLDEGTFSPERLPVVLNAGNEHYVQTLHEQGDIDAALLRYLRAGGLLMCLTSQPFPFYYNEAGDAVVSAPDFGLPIAGSGANLRDDVPDAARVRGWETPPPERTLTFHVNTEELPGLPEEVPFPETGDLRWRPATQALTAQRDVYLPLAELTDEAGVAMGDGIAYIEHRASEPRGGKVLYVWMGMPKALGGNDLLYALFRFAAEKAGG